MILNLLNCTDVAIKARALHLLGLSLSTLEGQASLLFEFDCVLQLIE
mgnify:CR=1 FL=1